MIGADSSFHNVSDAAAYRSLLRSNLHAFIEFAFSVVRPGIAFAPNWHLEAVAHQLERVATGHTRRLIVTQPPRSLKSLCVSVALPAWFLGHNPSERVVVVCYSDTLSRQHANDFRLLVNHPIYRSTFPNVRIERETDREIVTTARGKRFTTSIDGTLTGMGGNLIVIDDPIKLGDVFSEAIRARVIEWYRSTLLTRGDNKQEMRIVVAMQRVHNDDLVGYLLEEGGFDVINLPAIAQREERFELGNGRFYVRRKGELLHATHEPPEALLELKRKMGSLAFSAQYQQSPILVGGRIIKRKYFSWYEAVGHERNDRIIISWDIALSETERGDYSVGVVLRQRGETFYILDVIRGRFPFDELQRTIIETKERWPECSLLIEESPISMGLIQNLRQHGINVVKYRPATDKQSRAITQLDLFEGRSVLFPQQAHWLDEFTSELLAFPGRHDDQVDALVQGLDWGRRSGRVGVGVLQGLMS